ncbi:hypothetical protein B0H14DRAFT_2782259, partial [Mycena olivaceomarginata]
LASEPSFTSPGERRVHFADHPLSPHLEQRRSAPIEPELARDPVSKPCSRRCFVMPAHRRSIAPISCEINNDGRLVSFDGSPLPMTRHPGGVAAHLISRFRNPTRVVLEPSKSPPAPRAAYAPPHPVSAEPHDHCDVSSPSREFNSRSPHDSSHRSCRTRAQHVPLTQIHPPHPSPSLDRARATILLVLLESMLD